MSYYSIGPNTTDTGGTRGKPPTRTESTPQAIQAQTLQESQIQLGELDYPAIKQSIIDYLSRDEADNPIKDLDYTASAVNILIDALAYNTLYYGYYSNMIVNELYLDTAQRLESLISLTKHLGFTVGGRTSSQASVNMTGLAARLPRYSKFIGTNDNGDTYTFYTRNSYEIDENNSASDVVLHEAKDLVLNRDITSQVDLTTQTYILPDDRVDINSIVVEVSEDGGTTFTEYTRSNFVNTTINSDSRVYFVERLNNSIKIVFSARGNGEFVYDAIAGTNPNLATDNVGRIIVATDKVRLSYFIPSGEISNEIRTFSYSDAAGSAEVVAPSFFGSDEPNPDLIKFFAPKWFAAQDRAVIKDDYYAIISDLISQDSTPNEVISIFGGEELDPPYYGRVFVSVITGGLDASQEIIDILQEKAPVSIIPEYIPPLNVNLNLAYNVNFISGQTQRSEAEMSFAIREAVETKFGGEKFNNDFSYTEFVNTISNVDPAILPDSIEARSSLTTTQVIDSSRTTQFSFKNQINDGQVEGQGLFSSSFVSPKFDFSDVYIVDSSAEEDVYGFSPLFLATDSGGVRTIVQRGGVGDINYRTGLVRIKPSVIQDNTSVTFTARPESISINAKQEMVLNVVQREVTITGQ